MSSPSPVGALSDGRGGQGGEGVNGYEILGRSTPVEVDMDLLEQPRGSRVFPRHGP